MLGLITDRTQENVDYLRALSRKGWAKMTSYERAIWTGNPLTAADFGYREPVNLLPNRVDYSSGISVLFRNSYFVATGSGSATIIIGVADDFIGKDVTLSVGAVSGTGYLSLAWYNSENDYQEVTDSLGSQGSVVATLNAKPGIWNHLAMRIYGRNTTYHKVMVELGDTRHDYVPYTPVLPTMATKGAYNYSDLNRVEKAVEELSERWNLDLETKTDWTLWDVPTEADMHRFKENLDTIATERIGEPALRGISYDLSMLTYEDANRIESFLISVSNLEV